MSNPVQAQGFKSILQVAVEATYGVDAGSGAAGLPCYSHTLKGTQTQDVPEVVTGLRSAYKPQPGAKGVSGDIVVPVDDTLFATWLGSMFDEAGLLKAVQDSFTIHDPAPAAGLFKYTGIKIIRLAMTLSKGAPIRATLSVLGAGVTAATSTTPTAVAITPYLGHQLAFQEGGAALAGATQLTLNIDFGISEQDWPITGGDVRKQLSEGSVKVTGELTALLSDTTLIAKALGNTASSLGFTLTNDTNILTCKMPEVLYGFPTTDLPGPQGRLVVLPYQAYVDTDADESAVQMLIAASGA